MDTKYKKHTYKKLSAEILDIIGDYQMDGDNEYYTKGSFTNRYKVKDIDIYIYELLKIFFDKGINFGNFMQEFGTEVLNDFRFNGDSYFMDYLLYKFEPTYPIGGLSLNDSETDELVIKYKYGYFKYDLGIKFILQSYKSLEEYFKATAKDFIYSMLYGSEIRNEFQAYFKYMTEKYAKDINNLSSVVKEENNLCYLVIDLDIFSTMMKFFIEIFQFPENLKIKILKLLEYDLKKMKIEYKYIHNKYLILFFGEKIQNFNIDISNEINQLQSNQKNIDEFIDSIKFDRDVKKYNL